MSADGPQWALLAAVGAALTALSALVAGPGARSIGLVIVPNLAWCGFFLAWRRGPHWIRRAALAALVFAIPPRALALAAYLSVTLDMNGVGWILVIAECAAVAGWVWLLIALAAKLRRPPLASIAAALSVAVILASVNEILAASAQLVSIGGTAAVFWKNHPLGTFWRVAAEPALQLLYVAAQIFFLRALAKPSEPHAAWGRL